MELIELAFDSVTFMKPNQMVVCGVFFLALQSGFAKHFSVLQVMENTIIMVFCTLWVLVVWWL